VPNDPRCSLFPAGVRLFRTAPAALCDRRPPVVTGNGVPCTARVHAHGRFVVMGRAAGHGLLFAAYATAMNSPHRAGHDLRCLSVVRAASGVPGVQTREALRLPPSFVCNAGVDSAAGAGLTGPLPLPPCKGNASTRIAPPLANRKHNGAFGECKAFSRA
jgi:hypothetical protein